MTTHLTDDELVLHYYGEMESADERRAESHLSTCGACQQTYTRLQRVMAFVDSAPAVEAPPGFERTAWARLQPALPARRSRCVRASLALFSQKAELIDARRADIVDYLYDRAVLGTSVGFHEYALVCLVCEFVFNLGGQVGSRGLFLAEEDGAVSHDSNEQRIFFIGVGHLDRGIGLCHVHAYALLQHWRDDHENDQKHRHHVDHRGHVNVRVHGGCAVSYISL